MDQPSRVSQSTFFLIHCISRPLPPAIPSLSRPSLLVKVLHFHNRLALRLADPISKNHDLVLGSVVLGDLLAEGAFNTLPDLDI